MGANQYGSFGFPSMVNRSSHLRSGKGKKSSSSSTIVRVTSIITEPPYPGANNLIGVINGEEISRNGIPTKRIITNIYPSDPYKTIMPVIGEFVIAERVNYPNSPSGRWVYGSPISLYGITSQNVNSSPSPFNDQTPLSQTVDYSQAFVGATNIVPNNETGLDYNSPHKLENTTFIERGNIHPLLPFEGDILHEGRWGNSIRFGSTVKSKNLWSTSGNNGDPITIIRNGQNPNSSNFGSEPIVENINEDLSAIYLTSYQQLPLSPANKEKYNSYPTDKIPIFPSQYSKPQILINSDRIVINAKTDSILMSSQQSISLSTIGSVNIDATSHYVSSNDIRLGSKAANQSVLLGDDTIDLLIELTKAVSTLAQILQVQYDFSEGELKTSYNAVAGNVLLLLNNPDPKKGILAKLTSNQLKSTTTKVL